MKKVCAVVLMTLCLFATGAAGAAQVPRLINYQSLVYDDGGLPVADGSSVVTFRITDIAGSVLYEEKQIVDVVHSVISAMVGNGLDPNGAPTGGIPLEIFESDGGRYLEVMVEGYEPQSPLEIVSVPYAFYAERAVGVADGSIDGKAIAKESITVEHLAQDAMQDLGDALATDGGVVVWTTLQQISGASGVGVQSGMTYTSADNVQTALQDLDTAISHRDSRIDVVEGRLDQEIVDRQAGDAERVSRHGDSMDGNLSVCGDLSVQCGGDLMVNGSNIRQTVEENRTYLGGLKVLAWGSVDSDGTLLFGNNAQLGTVVTSTGSYEVQFLTSPGSAQYAVIVNCVLEGTAPCLGSVTNKTSSSFMVRMASVPGGFSEQSFDFMVYGQQ